MQSLSKRYPGPVGLVQAAIWRLDPLFARYSLVPTGPIIEPALFPWTASFEARWYEIQMEVRQIMERPDSVPGFGDISGFQRRLSGGWKTYFLYGYGYRVHENCMRAPTTAALLAQLGGPITAFFSVFMPRTRIPVHRGLLRGFLRYHLGLVVPEPPETCGLRVGGIVRHWRAGGSLVFDDTYHHEAWNDSDSMRIVLFVDFPRPMRLPGRVLFSAVTGLLRWSPYVRRARRNLVEWEKAHLGG